MIVTGNPVYTPVYNQEFNILVNSGIIGQQSKVYNPHGALGNVIMDLVLQRLGSHRILSVEIDSQSGVTQHDAIVRHISGSCVFEIKIRHDDDYMIYPNTCLGELSKYNYLLGLHQKSGYTPFILFVHKNGEVNIFNILKCKKPKTFFTKTQKSIYNLQEEKYVELCVYVKNDKYCQTFKINNYNNLLNYLCNTLQID